MKGNYLIAGATGAIGRSLVNLLYKNGNSPILIGRSNEKLNQISNNYKNLKSISMDFNDTDNINKINYELKDLEYLDGMCYAIGSIDIKSIKKSSPIDYINSYRLNVLGAIELIKSIHPQLKKKYDITKKPSSIVLFSSIAAHIGFKNHSIISCSKSAINGLTISLASEMAPYCRINSISPSLTKGSEISQNLIKDKKIESILAKNHPLLRLGDPNDSAYLAEFLLSEKSDWITGQNFCIDGGKSKII